MTTEKWFTYGFWWILFFNTTILFNKYDKSWVGERNKDWFKNKIIKTWDELTEVRWISCWFLRIQGVVIWFLIIIDPKLQLESTSMMASTLISWKKHSWAKMSCTWNRWMNTSTSRMWFINKSFHKCLDLQWPIHQHCSDFCSDELTISSNQKWQCMAFDDLKMVKNTFVMKKTHLFMVLNGLFHTERFMVFMIHQMDFMFFQKHNSHHF